jgi:hypothetical protein
MPSYHWWVLKNGAWQYLGRYTYQDFVGFWTALQFVPEAQLYTRLASP